MVVVLVVGVGVEGECCRWRDLERVEQSLNELKDAQHGGFPLLFRGQVQPGRGRGEGEGRERGGRGGEEGERRGRRKEGGRGEGGVNVCELNKTGTGWSLLCVLFLVSNKPVNQEH